MRKCHISEIPSSFTSSGKSIDILIGNYGNIASFCWNIYDYFLLSTLRSEPGTFKKRTAFKEAFKKLSNNTDSAKDGRRDEEREVKKRENLSITILFIFYLIISKKFSSHFNLIRMRALLSSFSHEFRIFHEMWWTISSENIILFAFSITNMEE